MELLLQGEHRQLELGLTVAQLRDMVLLPGCSLSGGLRSYPSNLSG
jgi:hypothetical protein